MVVRSIQNNSVGNFQAYKPQFKGVEDSTETGKASNFVGKYITPQNVILGSLATLGVLGMADIVLCGGKHLDKITGRSGRLEEAVSKAKAAETKLSQTETKLQNTESNLHKAEQKLEELRNALEAACKGNAALKSEKEGFKFNSETLLKSFQNLYTECLDFEPEVVQYFRKEFQKTLRQLGMEFLEVTPSHPKFYDLCDVERGGAKNFDLTAVPIVHTCDQSLVLRGHCFMPEK